MRIVSTAPRTSSCCTDDTRGADALGVVADDRQLHVAAAASARGPPARRARSRRRRRCWSRRSSAPRTTRPARRRAPPPCAARPRRPPRCRGRAAGSGTPLRTVTAMSPKLAGSTDAPGDAHQPLLHALPHASRRHLLVLALQRRDDLRRPHAVRAHRIGVELHADLPRVAADDVHAADAGDGLDARRDHLVGEAR